MKKLFLLLCVICLGAASLWGCSSGNDGAADSKPFLSRYKAEENIAKQYGNSNLPSLSIFVNTEMVKQDIAEEKFRQYEEYAANRETVTEKYLYYSVEKLDKLLENPEPDDMETDFYELCEDKGYAFFWRDSELRIKFDKGKPDEFVVELGLLAYGYEDNGEKTKPNARRVMLNSLYPIDEDGTLRFSLAPVESNLYPLNGNMQCGGIRLQCRWGNEVYAYLIPYLVCFNLYEN